jgi:hypothetical protein
VVFALKHAADVVRRLYSTTGQQYAVLAATPVYLLSSLRRGSFSIRSLVRYNWTLALLGAAGGYATGMAITSQESDAATAARTFELRRDAAQVRQDDHYLVGAAVGALVTPALFMGRAGLINGALGGAALGGAGGLAWYYSKFEGLDGIAQRARQAVGQGKAKAKEAEVQGRQMINEAKGDARPSNDITQRAQATFDEAKDKAEEAEVRARQFLSDVKAKGKQELNKRA